MMSLHVDDVLLLDKRLNEPVELIIEGQTIFRGQPAKSDGNHAVVITELCSTE
jgi:flagellar motor switch protein FliM